MERKKLKIYTNTEFPGIWPVGTAAVIVAESPEQASELLKQNLLPENAEDVRPDQFIEINTKEAKAYVLCDGEY